MWVVPGATQRYIKNKSVGVRDKTLGLVLHVQDGNGELTGWFNNPDAEASSCWQVRKDGQILQFGDPDVDKFWTQAAGNPNWGAVETEGRPNEPLTPAQVEGVAQIYAAGHVNEGWPFQITDSVSVRGLGTHAMGGRAWGGHTGCPGDLRKAQRGAILARARQIAAPAQPAKEWDEMATKAEVTQAVIDALNTDGLVASPMFGSNPTVAPVTALRYSMEWSLAARNAAQVAADPARLAAAVAPLLPSGAVKQSDLEAALRKVLGSVDNPKES